MATAHARTTRALDHLHDDDGPATARRTRQALTVHDVMTWPAPFAQAVMPIRSLRRHVLASGSHEVPVLSWGECIGVVCACDLEGAPDDALVLERMRATQRTVWSTCTLVEVAHLMDHYGVDLMTCPWKGRLGVVTRDDLASVGIALPRCASCGGVRHLPRACGMLPRSCSRCDTSLGCDIELAYYRDLGDGD